MNGFNEAILLTDRGHVSEGPGENIFIIKNNNRMIGKGMEGTFSNYLRLFMMISLEETTQISWVIVHRCTSGWIFFLQLNLSSHTARNLARTEKIKLPYFRKNSPLVINRSRQIALFFCLLIYHYIGNDLLFLYLDKTRVPNWALSSFVKHIPRLLNKRYSPPCIGNTVESLISRKAKLV